jgi:translocation and assembly module TamB
VTASVLGERLGRAELSANLTAAKGRALLARTSAVDARLDAEVESVRALGGLLGISARVEGRGSFDVAASGTVGKPLFRGAVDAQALRFDWPSAGIALRDGTLRARLTPELLHVEELTFAAAKGNLRASGEVPLDGREARFGWEAKGLRVLDRPDRNLEVSGKGDASLAAGRLALRGELRAKRGYIEVPRVTQSRLGDDVIVLGRERPTNGARTTARLDLDLELGAARPAAREDAGER